MSAACVQSEKPHYRVPIRERLRVWYSNWKVRHVGKAVRVLSKALQDDPEFRQAWRANIAMPIYDYCQSPWHGLCDPSTDKPPQVTIRQANEIADRLMRHLFEVPLPNHALEQEGAGK